MAAWVALGLSTALHWAITPFSLLPTPSGIEFKDVDDELTIPVDLLQDLAEEPKPPPPTGEPPPTTDPTGELTHKPDATPPKPKPDAAIVDAGEAPDADAEPADAEPVVGGVALSDGGAASDSAVAELVDAGDSGGLASAAKDAGASKVGFAGLVTAGPTNVRLLMNVALIRQHPVGARLGPLVSAIPQWADFMKGQTALDPIRDTEWILIYGPSLIHTEKDAIIIHYSLPDAVIDRAIDMASRRYDKGGPFDAGVPGVKAALGHADNSERVFLRVQPHEAAVVPPSKARDFALLFKQHAVDPGLRPGEAVRLVVRDPYRQVAIPNLKFPQTLSEIRLWVIPRPDQGADVFAEGDCTGEAEAADVASRVSEVIKQQNSSIAVRIVTRGLLNNVDVRADGRLVKLHVTASREQIEGIFQVVAAQLGVQLPAAGGPQVPAAPSPPVPLPPVPLPPVPPRPRPSG